MFIKDVSKQYKHKFSPCRLLMEAYRDEQGKPRSRTILNLSKLPEKISQVIEQVALGKRVVALEDITQTDNRSLGEVSVLKKLSDKLGISKILNQHLGNLVGGLVLAMVINRISLPKSRYSLTEWLETTYLPEILKIQLSEFHYNKLYSALMKLSAKQTEIEDELWQETGKRESGLKLMLYDISSTYLEGLQCELAEYGHRYRKKKELIIALVTTEQGRPVTVRVLPGNTQDASTLIDQVNDLKQRFGIEEIVYVFDRGMHDGDKKLAQLKSHQIKYITALRRKQIRKLQERGVIQLGLFDQEIAEYEHEGKRYIICKSDQTVRNKRIRERLLSKTSAKLEMVKRNVEAGRWKQEKVIAAKAERWLREWGMKSYYQVEIGQGKFSYLRKQQLVESNEILDQVYVLETTVTDKQKHPAEQIRDGYKGLSKVERDFRVIKSVLDIRPVNHRKKETVLGHVFICSLALYIKRELEIQLQPLFAQKRPELTFSRVLTQLREIRQSRLTANGYQISILNQQNQLQKQILSTLNMKLQTISLPDSDKM